MVLRQIPQFLTPLRSRIFSRAVTSDSKALTLPRLPIFEALNSHRKSKTAIVHSCSGQKFTYGELLAATARYKERLLVLGKAEKEQDLKGERVAILVENGFDYVGTLFKYALSLVSSGCRMVVLIGATKSINAKHLRLRWYCCATVHKSSNLRNAPRDV